MRWPKMTDPYAVLGVSPSASQDEITHAYRRQLRAHHPDVRPAEPNSADDERLRQILAAYALLRDPRRRSDYDRTYAVEETTPPARVTVTHIGFPDDRPPLWAGPVRWHR
jgi:curved DNA-binding protein CbpA